ncbi:carbon monoxide dehydrogenase [Azorhizobium oxalatiphilum]|uniref:Carbon monoxide dehydrogenase n=1 Tax=Azorhizobium oxalatiphilum TaxID=980631 RepID=A0A917BMC6_9HYPH|nr:2Fe-2S iron-sulfur cluster-binding protein [Azorhizobium oxalatiphilum]GGF50396.1 carbon monoxide dehydrogenase [Azorhizobium oxalatiphilum]
MNAPLRHAGPTGLVTLTINGRSVAAEAEPRTHLADFLRDTLNLTGTHTGCEHGVCGACTVELDGEPARACLTFAAACQGAQVRTIEGLADDAVMAELRAAFNREHALQCGFCTPGMLVSARDLVLRLPEADERRIRLGLAGNLCRCTGYAGIVAAIASVITERRARGIPAATAERRLGPVGAHAGVDAIPSALVATASAAVPLVAQTVVDLADDFVPAHRFAQAFALAFPPEQVAALFADVEAVAACLPGAIIDSMPEPGFVRGGMRVTLGPISTTFRGTARVTQEGASGRIRGAGGDGRSSTQGEIAYRILPGAAPGTSRVELEVGYTLKGPLAQFSRPGLVREVAGRLIAAFARNLEARLSGRAVNPDDARGLSPLRLVLSLIADRLRRLFAPRA